MSKLLKINSDKTINVSNELVEGSSKVQLKDGKLHVNEIDESTSNIRITNNGMMYSTEFIENVDGDGGGDVVTYIVNYSIIGSNGALTVTQNGIYISNGAIINQGSNITFTAIPTNDYKIKQWKLNNTIVNGTNSTYTINNIQNNINITVEFEYNLFNVTYSTPSGGTIFATLNNNNFASNTNVTGGSVITFNAIPNSNFVIDKWTDNGSTVNSTNTSYTKTINNNTTIVVTFKQNTGGGCYLTTTMVEYYNLDDDGIELTSMRKLRSYYKEKHVDILNEYTTMSKFIINGIKSSINPNYYYKIIKDIVDEIVILVNNKQWSEAENLYLNLYYKLKKEFIKN